MTAKRCAALLVVVVLCFSPLCFLPFHAWANPAYGSTTITLYPVADAYVNSTSPDTNYGAAVKLFVSINSENDFFYVKFDLSSIPSGANIIYAILETYVSSTGGNLGSSDIIGAHYCSDNSWSEIGISWSNKPSFNSQSTDRWYYSSVVDEYKSWDITADVKTARSSGIITEALKFDSNTDNGYVILEPRESPNTPRLQVEYSTSPVFTISLESAQDTGATSNLGFTTIGDSTFSLPTSIEIVAGAYQIAYSGGYKLTKWEASGGISVSNINALSTTVTISGSGTLRAVGDVTRLEYSYDAANPESKSEGAGKIDAVRFTPLFSGQLLSAYVYITEIYPLNSSTYKVHFMDKNRQDKITPFQQTPTSEGWQNIDLSPYAITVNPGTDFYIGFEWTTDHNPALGEDASTNFDRSWRWDETSWQQETYGDFMVRAVVAAPLTYEFTVSATAGGSTNQTSGSHVYNAGTSVSVQATANAGYVFDHWELDGVPLGNANPYAVTMNANHELHAVFKQGTSLYSSSPMPETTASPIQSATSGLSTGIIFPSDWKRGSRCSCISGGAGEKEKKSRSEEAAFGNWISSSFSHQAWGLCSNGIRSS